MFPKAVKDAIRVRLPPVSSTAPDGKLYDAYVSFLRPDTLSSAGMASFALHILPEVLENQHGYSLYIRGRDDCPGEGQGPHPGLINTLNTFLTL